MDSIQPRPETTVTEVTEAQNSDIKDPLDAIPLIQSPMLMDLEMSLFEAKSKATDSAHANIDYVATDVTVTVTEKKLVAVEMSFLGLNVRPVYANALMNKTKKIEIRKYPPGRFGTSSHTFIIQTQTQSGARTVRSQVLGLAIFHESAKIYLNRDQFEEDQLLHLIRPESEFGWKGQKLYGWRVKTIIPFFEPLPITSSLPKRTIVGWQKPVTLTPLLQRSVAETLFLELPRLQSSNKG